MADQFLAEQHAWTLAQNSQVDGNSDEANSWVMLGQDGNIVPIPNERILHKSRSRVAMDLSLPRQLQSTEPFSLRSDSGIAYITNKRLIYLPSKPNEQFKSFFAPILNFEDTHVHSSWIGPWSWTGIVKPVAGGGLPIDLLRVEMKLTFKDGGHSEFQTKFELIKDRLHHARELELETGQTLIVTDEQLPAYQASDPAIPPQAGGAPSARADGAGLQTDADTAPQNLPISGERPSQHAPEEPPPDYLEAQAQAVGMQYEERMRDEAERH